MQNVGKAPSRRFPCCRAPAGHFFVRSLAPWQGRSVSPKGSHFYRESFKVGKGALPALIRFHHEAEHFPMPFSLLYDCRKIPTLALIGFQGRGRDEVVQSDFYHDLFLKALPFQWPYK